MTRPQVIFVTSAAVLLAACATARTSVPPAQPAAAAPPADEPLAVSASRPITDVTRGTFTFRELGATVTNDFDGGRFSEARSDGDSVLVLHNRPENAPINNSAWYAFKVWSEQPDTITVRLTYENGRHRYFPKIRRVGGDSWTPLDSALIRPSAGPRAATFRLPVGPDTILVAGQEMLTESFFDEWTTSLLSREGISRRQFATSARGRTMYMVEAGAADARRHVLLISRQHPPEVTGTFALVAYAEEMLGDSPLAREFRANFRIHMVPHMNPDGVALGHWRHNAGGVDLNRDWQAFNQPETRAVRDEMKRLLAAPGSALWFFADFHSTNQDVFYTLNRALETQPRGVLDRWIEYLRTSLPNYEVNDSPSANLDGNVSRDWAYRDYKAPGMVYEVGDNTDRALIRTVAQAAARGTMQILLQELRAESRTPDGP